MCNKYKSKKCNRCGVINNRGQMYHIQCGFIAVWACKDTKQCQERVKKNKLKK